MAKIEIKTPEMGESLLTAIIFLFFGIFLITDPVEKVKMGICIFGGLVTLVGVFKLLIYYKSTNENKKEILNGGMFILLGMATIVCVLLFYDTVKDLLRYILAIYLLYIGINRIVYTFKIKDNKLPYFINAGIIIVISILIAALPIKLELALMGWFIVLYAVVEIIGFIFSKKIAMSAGKVDEAVVVKEKVEEKDEQKLLK